MANIVRNIRKAAGKGGPLVKSSSLKVPKITTTDEANNNNNNNNNNSNKNENPGSKSAETTKKRSLPVLVVHSTSNSGANSPNLIRAGGFSAESSVTGRSLSLTATDVNLLTNSWLKMSDREDKVALFFHNFLQKVRFFLHCVF